MPLRSWRSLTCARFAPDGLSLLLADEAGRLFQHRLAAPGDALGSLLVDTSSAGLHHAGAPGSGAAASGPLAVTDVCVVPAARSPEAVRPASKPFAATTSTAATVVLSARHALVAVGTGDGGSCVLPWVVLDGDRGSSTRQSALECALQARATAGSTALTCSGVAPAGDVRALAAGITPALPPLPADAPAAGGSGSEACSFTQLASQLLGLVAVRRIRAAAFVHPFAPAIAAGAGAAPPDEPAPTGRKARLLAAASTGAGDGPAAPPPPAFVLVCVASAAGNVTATALPSASSLAAAGAGALERSFAQSSALARAS